MLTFILLYIIYITLFKGYIICYPTVPVYPDNHEELKVVKQEIAKRTPGDVDFFFLTNDSVAGAFLPHVDESLEELDKIVVSQNFIITFFKYLINRRRPYQIDDTIKPLSLKTARTPSFPAGHAYQALVLAKHLSKKYPEKEKLFYELAERCDDCRVKAGLHYPSDGQFSKRLFNLFNP